MNRLSLYSPMRAQDQGDLPMRPFVYIELGTYTREGDHVLLSSQLICDAEIDEAVAILKADLDKISHSAKRELHSLRQSAKAKWSNSASSEPHPLRE